MIRKTANILFYVIAAFYVFMMLDLFLRFSYIFDAGRIISRSYNLIPFKTIWNYTNPSGNMNALLYSFANVNIYGNIAAFIPYGVYVQAIKKRREFANSLLTVLVTSMTIEIIQFIFGLGVCDIDDVLLNCCGGITGIIGYRLLRRIFKEEGRTKTAITVISVAVGVPIIYLYFTTVFNHLRL